jgi:hypothetical protein
MVAHGHSWAAHCIRNDRGKSQLNRNNIAVEKQRSAAIITKA